METAINLILAQMQPILSFAPKSHSKNVIAAMRSRTTTSAFANARNVSASPTPSVISASAARKPAPGASPKSTHAMATPMKGPTA